MTERPQTTIPHDQLPAARPGAPLAVEWETYRREVGRLLAEGGEGKYVLIKGEEVVGTFEAWESAREAGLGRYPAEPFLAQRIRAEEPVLRIRGYSSPCPP